MHSDGASSNLRLKTFCQLLHHRLPKCNLHVLPLRCNCHLVNLSNNDQLVVAHLLDDLDAPPPPPPPVPPPAPVVPPAGKGRGRGGRGRGAAKAMAKAAAPPAPAVAAPKAKPKPAKSENSSLMVNLVRGGNLCSLAKTWELLDGSFSEFIRKSLVLRKKSEVPELERRRNHELNKRLLYDFGKLPRDEHVNNDTKLSSANALAWLAAVGDTVIGPAALF